MPEFARAATGGERSGSADGGGKRLVIYFYPKDMSAARMRRARGIGNLLAASGQAGARIVGVARDGLAAHEKFKARVKLAREPLADENSKLGTLLDVSRERSVVRSMIIAGHAEKVREAAQSV